MKLDVPFKILDIKPNKELLEFNFNLITEEHWNRFLVLRENLPDVFRDTKTFCILQIPLEKRNDLNSILFSVESINADHPIFPIIMDQVRVLEKFYDATAKNVVLGGLNPKDKVFKHFDKLKLCELCHRVHLPLQTDPDVKFFIDNIPYHFKKGEFFEFDNQRFHEVHNNSSIFRIHLVVDLLPNTQQEILGKKVVDFN